MSDTIYLRDIRQRPGFLTVWERLRHQKAHWFVELFAESLGVFLYCYAGVGSTAAYIIGNLSSQAGLGCMLIARHYSIIPTTHLNIRTLW